MGRAGTALSQLNLARTKAAIADTPDVHAALASYEAEMARRSASKVLKSREAAEQLHTDAATCPSNSTRAAAARAVLHP